MVERSRSEICNAFKLNIDQEIVINEVSRWFMRKPAKEGTEENDGSPSKDDTLIDGLSDLSQESKKSKNVDFSEF